MRFAGRFIGLFDHAQIIGGMVGAHTLQQSGHQFIRRQTPCLQNRCESVQIVVRISDHLPAFVPVGKIARHIGHKFMGDTVLCIIQVL